MNRVSIKRKHRRVAASRPKITNSSRSARKSVQKQPLLQEYSVQLLHSSWNQSPASFTGLEKNRVIGAPYASTSRYLRHLLNDEAGKLISSPGGKQNCGSPLYKTLEEYYDEVIALKKQIQDLTNENAVLKLKAQRTEEEYLIRKQQDVEQNYMDSTKVEHTLRQKLALVEKALREKDLAYCQLQGDLKATKMEEMKAVLEVYFAEIQRLKKNRRNRITRPPKNRLINTLGEESSSKTKELVKALQKMGAEKSRLIQENTLLKDDLQKCMEKQQRPAFDGKYEDMTKGELLSAITKLELKVKKMDSGDSDRLANRRSSRPDVEGKLALEGNLVQRLDQLDKRESELLEELSKKKSVIVQLREDRTYYQDKCSKNEKEMKQLRKEITELQEDSSNRRDDRSHVNRPVVSGRRSPSTISIRSSSSKHDRNHQFQVDNFRHNRAAKVIQRGWRQHRHHAQGINEEVELIQTALKGHSIRRKNLSRLRGFMAEDDNDDDSEDILEESEDDAIQRIQSTMKGHRFRKRQLSRSPLEARRPSNASSIRSLSQHPSSQSVSKRFSGDSLNLNLSPRSNHYSDSGRMTPSIQMWSHGSGRFSPAQALRTITDDSDDSLILNSSRQRPIF